MSRLLNGFPYSVRRTVYAVTDKKHPASASGARNEALRALVRAISETDHEGVQRQTALALGLPPSTPLSKRLEGVAPLDARGRAQ